MLKNDKDLIKRVKKYKIFKEIIFFDFSKEQIKNNKSKLRHLKNFLLLNRISKNEGDKYKKFDEILIFFDLSLIGKVLNREKIKYILLEDGLDCYKKNYNNNKPSLFKSCVKKMFYGYSYMGDSKNIKYIEVNDVQGINIGRKKIVECKRIDLINKLDDKSKKIIQRIFLKSDFKINSSKKFTLILTQPFYEDGYLSSEIEQVKLYNDIINNYCHGEVIVKVHPRDKCNYIFDNKKTHVINRLFPVEVLNFNKDIEIETAITISSTSIESLEFVNNKITLGWDYLYEWKK